MAVNSCRVKLALIDKNCLSSSQGVEENLLQILRFLASYIFKEFLFRHC